MPICDNRDIVKAMAEKVPRMVMTDLICGHMRPTIKQAQHKLSIDTNSAMRDAGSTQGWCTTPARHVRCNAHLKSRWCTLNNSSEQACNSRCHFWPSPLPT